MRINYVLIAIAVFVAGVIARSFFAISPWLAAFLAALGAAALAMSFLTKRDRGIFLAAGFLMLIFCLGVLRYDLKDRKYLDSSLLERAGTYVTLIGTVIEEPDERMDSSRLVLRATRIKNSREPADILEEKILLIAPRYPERQYGDVLEVSGRVEEPQNFTDLDKGGREFDWKGYLAKDDIFTIMRYPQVKKIVDGGGSDIKAGLLAIKHRFTDNIARILPEPQASFLGGLTVGARKSMPLDLQEDFRRAGVIHLVVLSGYNITIIADNILRAMKFLPLPNIMGAAVGAVGVAFFAIMTGASATVVRASIMALLVLLARSTGRIYEASAALFMAGFFMVLENPKILRFDQSFQLSFLATLGLIYFAPQIEKFLSFLPLRWGLRDHATATVSAQLAVSPLLLHTMGAVSLVALPVNLLILLFIPTTMLFGFLAGALSFIHYILSVPFVWIAWVLLTYEIAVVEFFAKFKFAEFITSEFSSAYAFIVYGFLILLAFNLSRKEETTAAGIS